MIATELLRYRDSAATTSPEIIDTMTIHLGWLALAGAALDDEAAFVIALVTA